jgi:putative ABC transport system ATP-binding protein
MSLVAALRPAPVADNPFDAYSEVRMSQAAALIELSEVTKVYRMGDVEVHALAGLSLSVHTSEFVAVMGSSGSGKSTLMNLIGCLDRPTSGSYRLAGRDVAKLGANELAEVRNRTLGFVFQSFNLLARTSALENVELPLLYAGVPSRERHKRAEAALARVGLSDRMHHHPNQMSGGQQQRVAIARAIVNEPALILADEPTGNLDSRTSLEIIALFQELGRAGMTIVLVTHEEDIAEYTARVVMMRDGRMLSDQPRTPRLAQLEPPSAAEVVS